MANSKSDIKLLIAVPTLDYIHYLFVESLTNLVKRLSADGVNYDICFRGGTLVYLSRDWLVRHAAGNGYSHILWLDADMMFEPDVLDRLLGCEKPLAAGVYRGRHDKLIPCVFSSLKPIDRWTDIPKEGVYPIEGCGFGCVLTETLMMERIYNRYGTCFTPTPEFGEDLAFCDRARLDGYFMVADCSVKCGHIGQAVIECDGTRKAI